MTLNRVITDLSLLMNKAFFPSFSISFFTCFFILTEYPVNAQSISSDGTLPTPTEVTPTTTGVEINGGTTAGSNLFHSFKDFSVLNGNEAFFNNADTISNIFSRVTGGNPSNIDGLIKANGGANLFLINPTGIIFGEGARLDIGGSFYGSTANSILFPNGVEFSVADTQTEPILTINAPIGFNFRDNPVSIKANNIQELSNTNLNLIGGEISLDNSQLFGNIITLGGLTNEGIVEIGEQGNLIFPDDVAKADVTLLNSSKLGSFSNDGLININANNLKLDGSSQIQSAGSEANINIQADDSVFLNQNSFILTEVSESSESLENKAGSIIINATNQVFSSENSSIVSEVKENRIGSAGDIKVTAGSLTLTGRSLWQANTKGQGNAGNITINVDDQTIVDDGSLILSQVLPGAKGDAGDINITTGSLTSNNGLIIADSKDQGNSGNIKITATDTISLQGVPIVADGFFPAQIVTGLDQETNNETGEFTSAGQGKAGNITISADQLIMNDLAFVTSNSELNTVGEAGEITINVDRLRLENNSFIGTFTENEFDAGSISVNAQTLELLSGGKLVTSTLGSGDAGNINLNITDTITLDNVIPSKVEALIFDEDINNQLQGQNGLFANATGNATGNGGSILIGTNSNLIPNQNIPKNVTIANGAEVRVDGGSQGSAGVISLAANSLSLNNASIFAETAFGQEGNINLQVADNITLKNNSLISARATNNANGGNVTIDTDFIVAFPNQNNDIIADAQQGEGGNITIKAQSVFGIEERPLNSITNDINASSALGTQFDGVIKITIPDVDPFQETAQPSDNVVDPDSVVAGVCDASLRARNATSSENTFTINGKGGMPPELSEPFTAENILSNEQSIPLDAEEKALQEQYPPILTSQGAIYPARGMVKNPDGTVILTAYPTKDTQRTLNNSSNCN